MVTRTASPRDKRASWRNLGRHRGYSGIVKNGLSTSWLGRAVPPPVVLISMPLSDVCSHCGGNRVVDFVDPGCDAYDRLGRHPKNWIDCPVCKGSGSAGVERLPAAELALARKLDQLGCFRRRRQRHIPTRECLAARANRTARSVSTLRIAATRAEPQGVLHAESTT